MKQIEEIFQIELTRLAIEAQKAPLDADALRRLESLTRSLKNYSSAPLKDKVTDLGDSSLEDLFKLMRELPSDEPQST